MGDTLDTTGSSPSRGADDEALELLAATEVIHAALLGDGDVDGIGEAYDRRERAFDAMRGRVVDGEPPPLGPAARAAVARVRALDEEILEVGFARATAIRDERQSLRKRRSAIQAHTTRERGAPRVVTVKV
jgi:hypothetical protein